MTHDDLRKAAIRWLTNTKRCSVVLSEIVSSAGEIPDAIGFTHQSSILVECKVSRADFARNADKAVCRSGMGVGSLRFYLTPKGLVAPEEIENDWGLLWITESGRLAIQRDAIYRADPMEIEITRLRRERTMLVSALRRIKTREFIVLAEEKMCPKCEEGELPE